MAVRIKASPKLRDAKPRESEPQPAKARFVIQDRPAAPSSRGGGATDILKVSFVLILLAVGVNAIWSKIQGPDPHYLTARKLVRDYEFGKSESTRNYEHAAYGLALTELALVHPRSESAEAARAMQIELERRITAFREQQETVNRQLDSTRVKSRRKKEQELQARLHSLLLPQTEDPECELEEHGDSGGEHKH